VGIDDFKQSEMHRDEPIKRKKSSGIDQILSEITQQEDKHHVFEIN